MKIKVNNIFRNIKKNNSNNILKRRRNNESIESIQKPIIETESNEIKEYKRKGANRKKNNIKTLGITNKKHYLLFMLMFIFAAVSVYTNYITYKDSNKESYTVFNNIEESESISSSVVIDSQNLDTNNNDTRKEIEEKLKDNEKIKNETIVKKNIIEPLIFIKPLNGEIIKEFSLDKLIYSKTLQSWRTHDGIDIKGNIGDNVRSIERGIIEKIYDDSFLGTTVIIDHGQGYKSSYSNLDNKVSVKEKDVIKKGVVIGKVGRTSIGEIKDGPHIHFMIMYNNKVIDPASKIKF